MSEALRLDARRQRARHRDRGSVTAELAVGLSGVVMVLGAMLGTVAVAQAQLRAVDAAGAGARAAARGEAGVDVIGLTARLAGPGARTELAVRGSVVTVTVRLPVEVPLPGAPRITVSGSASTPAEPQVVA